MGKVTRKRYTAEFKARVALEAIKGEQTLAELGSKHGVHQTMIAALKRQAIEGMSATFGSKAEAVAPTSEAELTGSRQHRAVSGGTVFWGEGLRSLSVERGRARWWMRTTAACRLFVNARYYRSAGLHTTMSRSAKVRRRWR